MQKMLATAGVKLSFRTDSRTLKVHADMSFATGRTYYALDVVVAYGTNDWRFITPEDFFDRYCDLLDAIGEYYPAARVFLLTPIWRKDTDTESRWERFELVEQYVRKAAERLPHAAVIRGFDLVPHDEDFYADLRLHPNDADFERYFEHLWPEIKAVLKE